MFFNRSRRVMPTIPENSLLPGLCAGSEPWPPTSPPPAKSTGTVTATVSISPICPRAQSTTLRNTRRTDRLLEDYNAITTLTPEIDARFAQLARERIHVHPFRYYFTLPLLRLADMWLRPRVETMNVHLRWWQYAQHPAETRVALFYGALNLAYLVAAFLGALRWPRMAGAMVALIVLRSLLLATLEAPESRYTLECFPLVIVLAACYLTTWLVPGACLIWKTSAATGVL